MRFKIYTVVDITETNARRSDNKKEYSQQTNLNTVMQTVGLRVNFEPLSTKIHVDDVSKLGFGETVKGKQRYWEFTFDVEYESALSVDMMLNDFDLIPVITELDETVHNHNKVFRTTCPNDCNIVFEIVDR
jgi:hypothetical protein